MKMSVTNSLHSTMHEYVNDLHNNSVTVAQSESVIGYYNNTTETNPMGTIPRQLEYYLNGIVAMCVIFLGLVANFLTAVVLTRKTMHSSTNCFLTALALWDTMVLICTLFLMTLSHFSSTYEVTIHPYIVVYIYPLALVAQTSTVWITVSFTVERYIAVCHPLKAARMCSINRTRIVIVCVSIVSFIYNITRWFEYELTNNSRKPSNKTGENSTNQTFPFKPTEFHGDHLYNTVYYSYLYPIIMFVIPLSSLAIFNTCLIHAVKKSQKQQKDMNVRQSRENNVTTMLVSVVIVFMMCQVPAAVYNVARAIDADTVENMFGWQILSAVRNFLVTFNSAINFLLYCAFGQKFRRVFMRTFCYCFLSENDFNSMTYHGTMAVNDQSKKYRILMSKQKNPRNEMEMTSNVTQNTMLSKYSPNIHQRPSGSSKKIVARFQNGKHNQKAPNHHHQGHLFSDKHQTAQLLVNSGTPSPASSRTPSPI